MKNLILLCNFFLISLLSHAQEPQLFDDKTFLSGIIPNEGQLANNPFEGAAFFAQLGESTVYFFKDKLVFSRKENRSPDETDVAEDAMPSIKYHSEEHIIREEYHTEVQLRNANTSCEIVPELQQTFVSVFSYQGENGIETVRTRGYSQLVYRNIYPKIDWIIELDPVNGRLKYAFVLHPGSEPSDIRMHYANAAVTVSNESELIVESSFGVLTDRMGDVWYAKNNKREACSFVDLGNATIGFRLPFTKTKHKIIIDPWLSSGFFQTNYRVYDVDYDAAGNVYAYAKTSNFSNTSLIKLNASGTLVWTYYPMDFAILDYYGDFAIDRVNNQIYLVEGFNPWTGAQVYKLDADANLITGFPGEPLFAEMWRIAFSVCSNQAVIAGGGTTFPTYQTCFLDTSLTNLTMVQYVPTTNCCHDVGMLTLDEFGNCYQVTTHSSSFDGLFETHLVKLPLPTLVPITYHVPTGYVFNEVVSNEMYDYSSPSGEVENGFNGIATANNIVYTSDGRKLKKWDGSNGSLLEEVVISTPADTNYNYWSGIAVDGCGNLFVGVENKVIQFNADLDQVNAYNFPDSITDVMLTVNGELLVSGYQFVSRLQPTQMIECDYTFIDIQANLTPSDCDQFGAVTVQISGGEAPYNIVWNTNPPTYGPTLSNVLPGEYIVAVNDSKCANYIVHDTIVVTGNVSVANLFVHSEPVNVFTPNNDPENPVFYPLTNYLPAVIGAEFTRYSLVVTNRWGNVVFETTDKTEGWDGTVQSGRLAEEGVYYWLLSLETTCDKEVVQQHGFVHLQK